MSMLGEIGDTVLQEVCITVKWKIKDFFSLSGEINDRYKSPTFKFDDEEWYLLLFPNGDTRESSKGWVGLYLCRMISHPPKTVDYWFGIQCYLHTEVKIEEKVTEFSAKYLGWGTTQFCLRSELENRKSYLMPNNELTILCVIRCNTSRADSLCDRVCKKVINNMQKILHEGNRSDFTLKLGDRDWPVHKVILESRCEYFANMFRHDWVENTAGQVKFEDMEEDTLDSVLNFIYSGVVSDMSTKNVCEIYVAAHKFLLEDLKILCVECMKDKMCTEIVCKVFVITDKYEEADLKERAIEYFIEEGDEIFDTEEWKEFKKNHSSLVADLLEETTKRERKMRVREDSEESEESD